MRYEDIFDKLNEKRVSYVVVGGVAMALYGAMRMTADLDIVISFERGNVLKFIEAMEELGFKPNVPAGAASLAESSKRESFIKEKNMLVFSFYNSKEAMGLVDVLINEVVAYDGLKERSVTRKSVNTPIPVAALDDMIALKKASGRRQDLLDIEALEMIKKRGDAS
ncbi:MAG: hypothetical protein OEV59_00725 [Deltaproteobacteria bacterium]|nr:hypothetical protein [Deltaproteobacteria bacterium]